MRALVFVIVFVIAAAASAQEEAAAAVVDAVVDEEVADTVVDEEVADEEVVDTAPPAGVAASPFAQDGEVNSDGVVVNLTGIDVVDRVYFREDTFLGFLRSKAGEPLDATALEADAVEVTNQYLARGYLKAKVTVAVVKTTQGPRARFVVVAGERAELKEVHIVGNDLVAEADLKEGFFSRPPEPLGLLTRAGLYHKPYLDQDQQRLVFNYYKRGFLEARVSETRVTSSSDLSGLQVTLQVIEGAAYELAALTIEGELPPDTTAADLRKRVALNDGDVADLVLLQQQADPLLDAWRELGYPFARFEQQLAVLPPPSGDLDKKGIGITLKMVKGPLAVVRAVRIVGNKGTMEHVFRRELEVELDVPYDHKALKHSERNLMQTGLLQAATGRAVPVTEKPRADGTALVDVEFNVTETTTWMLSPAFFGDANEGLILIGIAGDRNLLGTGLQAFTSVQWSQLRFLFDASLTEPRLFGTRSSATIEAHRRELRYRDFIIGSVFGGSVRANYAYELGWRLGGPARWFVGGGLGVEYGGVVSFDDKQLRSSSLLPQATFRNTVEARGGFDSREGGLSPRNGLLVSLEASTAGPWTGSGLSFVDGHANVRGFWSPLWDITFKSNTQIGGIINPLGGQAPVTDRYFLGGLGSVRGFFPRSIGPLQQAPLVDGGTALVEVGGVVKFVQNLEVEVPIFPGLPVRGFVFADFGNTFGDDEIGDIFTGTIERDTDFLVANLMMSTGLGVLLVTPVLPFRFEWSIPVTKRDFDQPVNFFLGVGSAF